MAQQNIDFGTFPDDPSADAIRTAFSKVQNNFDQLFGTNANSTVNSINRTPGAGVTVNYPTGNVVISANIACLQVATTSLKVGRGSDNTQSNVTITSSSQQLNIDIDPEQVLSNNFASPGGGLANINGTLTANAADQLNITAVGTLTALDIAGNLSVAGNASFTSNANFSGAYINFANISNLHIQGGTLGYFLQTDGAGNLAWAAGGGGGSGSPGGINTYVQFNDAGGFGGNTGFTFNKTTGVLTTPSITVTNNAIIGNILGALANGNSNVNIPVANGNVNISAEGNANVFVVTGAGANLVGNLTVGNADLGNLATVNFITGALTTNAQPNITSTGTLSNLTVTGNIISGNVYSNSGTVGASLLTGTLTTAAQPNITSVGTLTSVSVSGNANVGNLNVANNAIITGDLSVLGNATYINITTLEIEDPIISLGGGPNGAPLTTDDGKDRGTALQYYTTQPVTAFMGWDNSNSEFAFGSNVDITSEVVTFTNYGNVHASYFKGVNTEFGNANLGNTATANFFIGRFYGNANAATVANTVVDNAQPNITSVGTLTSLTVSGYANATTFVGTLANGNSNVRIAADSNIGFSAIGNSNVVIITGSGINANGTGNFTGNLSAANLLGPLANGNSSVNIPSANGNVIITAVGNATLTVTGTGANVTGTANVTGNVLTAGIKTDNYYYANGVAISFAGSYGNSNVSSFLAAYGSNTITTTGNVSVGNIIGNGQALTGLTGANVTGAVTYATTANSVAGANVSGAVTYATTANSVAGANVSGAVTYATTANSVAGANVSGQVGNALVAGTVYTAAQPNITSTGTLTSLTVTNKVTAGQLQGDGGNISNIQGANVSGTVGTATSSTTAATVTTAAQPNITSVGTLSSLAVTANVTVGNLITNNYIIHSVGTGISAAGSTQGTGTALTKEINIVSTVASGAGVVLPTAVAGMMITVTNTNGNSLLVYPASGGQINTLGTNAGFTMGTTTIQFIAPTTTQWYTVGATYA